MVVVVVDVVVDAVVVIKVEVVDVDVDVEVVDDAVVVFDSEFGECALERRPYTNNMIHIAVAATRHANKR